MAISGTDIYAGTGGCGVWKRPLSQMVTGTSEINNNNNAITIFPNPFSTQTTLETEHNIKDATVTIYNSFGQKVKQVSPITFGAEQTINLYRDNLRGGLYFLVLTQTKKSLSVVKFIITD